MPEEGFRLPGSSYQELAKIIKAYGNLPAEATPTEVSHLAVIHPTIVSRNNAFLVSIGVLKGGKKKVITEKGRALARALEHEMPDEISMHWREIVLANEFLQKLVSAVRIRTGMEPSTLQAHVAYSAGQPKKPVVMTGASTVVDILKAAGLVKDEDGKLVAVSEETLSPDAARFTSQINRDQKTPHTDVAGISIVEAPIARDLIAVTIQIQIQCTANEVEDLAPKLRTLLKEILESKVPEQLVTGE